MVPGLVAASSIRPNVALKISTLSNIFASRHTLLCWIQEVLTDEVKKALGFEAQECEKESMISVRDRVECLDACAQLHNVVNLDSRLADSDTKLATLASEAVSILQKQRCAAPIYALCTIQTGGCEALKNSTVVESLTKQTVAEEQGERQKYMTKMAVDAAKKAWEHNGKKNTACKHFASAGKGCAVFIAADLAGTEEGKACIAQGKAFAYQCIVDSGKDGIS